MILSGGWGSLELRRAREGVHLSPMCQKAAMVLNIQQIVVVVLLVEEEEMPTMSSQRHMLERDR